MSILIVEDNQLDTLIVKTLLQNHFNLETVSTGQEALHIIEEIKFDIILMDIKLGNQSMDGTTLMKVIKSNDKYKNIKIFAVTAYAENETQFITEGFDGLYVKPVIKEEIFEFLNKNMI
ncbi:MAG: response regulator [Bacteroidota bacterium]